MLSPWLSSVIAGFFSFDGMGKKAKSVPCLFIVLNQWKCDVSFANLKRFSSVVKNFIF